MSAYYNEIDPLKAEIIRQAIQDGAIAPGDVDDRSIVDVRADDLVGYTQCHFFAGGGFWSLALRQAGWPDDRPVWTGSCPCPSFSAAGKGQGFSDPRHLWPHWARLIRERHPPTIFGEQVSAAIGHGWLDLVQTDLETEDYAVGKIVLGACSVGAPHIRQRLYFVAQSKRGGLECKPVGRSAELLETMDGQTGTRSATSSHSAGIGILADAADARRQTAWQHSGGQSLLSARPEQCGNAGIVENSRCRKQSECGDALEMSVERHGTVGSTDSAGRPSADCLLVDAEGGGLGMRGSASGNGGHTAQPSESGGVGDTGRTGLEGYVGDGRNRNQPGRLEAIKAGPIAKASEPCRLADADGGEPGDRELQRSGQQRQQPQNGGVGIVGISESERRQSGSAWYDCDGEGMESRGREQIKSSAGSEDAGSLANASSGQLSLTVGRPDQRDGLGPDGANNPPVPGRPGPLNGFWRGADWIGCRDGKFRPVEPGTFPLASGYPDRVGLLRLAGDAICVPAAQAFIESYLETGIESNG